MPDPISPSPQETKYVDLYGNVMGVTKDERTRPLHPALVRLKIHAEGKIYDPLLKKDMEKLQKEHDDVHHAVSKDLKTFQPVKVDNNLGYFEIKHVPTGWWCYIATAHVGKEEYDHRGHLGDNGFHGHDPIRGPDLDQRIKEMSAIIIPVKDEWLPKIPDVKVKDSKDAPTTDEKIDMIRDTIEK